MLVVRQPSSAVDEFGSEAVDVAVRPPQGSTTLESRTETPPRRGRLSSVLSVPVLSSILVALLFAGLVWTFGVPVGRRAVGARVSIESTPPGAQVIVGGTVRGSTPIDLELPAGETRVVVRAGQAERVLSLRLSPGDLVRQHIEITSNLAGTTVTTGTLAVTSEPARIALVIDGVPAGTTPLSATTLSAGEHVVSARFPTGALERRVRVEAGQAAALHLISPAGTTGSVVGWLNVASALPFRILEDGRLLGTTDVDRVMLPIGTHALQFVNEDTGFQAERTVTVTAGRPTPVQIDVPTATISINARPWAEVFIDGERIGETPIGNLVRPIGRHDLVLRHPEFGERRQTVVMSLRAPSRVSVDFQAR